MVVVSVVTMNTNRVFVSTNISAMLVVLQHVLSGVVFVGFLPSCPLSLHLRRRRYVCCNSRLHMVRCCAKANDAMMHDDVMTERCESRADGSRFASVHFLDDNGTAR